MTKYNIIKRAIRGAKEAKDFLTETEKANLIEMIKQLDDEHYNYNNHYEGSNTREIRGDY